MMNRPNADKPAVATVTPTISAGAYSANDVVGGLLTFTFANSRGANGMVRSIRIADRDNEKAACKLWLYKEPPTTIADNAAFAPPDSDIDKVIGVVAIAAADYTTSTANAFAGKHEQGIDFLGTNGAIYGYLVCDATPTYSATNDLTISITAYLL
jgi:hypothetical protein